MLYTLKKLFFIGEISLLLDSCQEVGPNILTRYKLEA